MNKKRAVRFISLEKENPRITGGQIYDDSVFQIIRDKTDKETSYFSLETDLSRKFLPLAPIIYLLKGLKLKRSDIKVFNSALYMRFLPLMIVLRILGYKNIHTIHHHFMYRQFKGIKKFIYRPCEWLFLKLSNHIIVPSPYILEELKKHVKESKLIFWRIPFSKKAVDNVAPKRGNLTYIGTIEERKGLKYLLEALKKLKDQGVYYHLNIIGKTVEHRYFEMLKGFIKQNDLNVAFKGFIDSSQKDLILKETDIFTFPSLLEGFGMVLVEAQNYGLPIVCFDNSAMPFTVKDGENGFLAPTGDSAKIAEAIKKILTDRALRKKLSFNAFENLKSQNSYENFETFVKDYFSLY